LRRLLLNASAEKLMVRLGEMGFIKSAIVLALRTTQENNRAEE
jgi:hypothetical protein